MNHDEMVALIRGGVAHPGGTWADFGAGSGNFTRVLRHLVGQDAAIYAIDRDARALSGQLPDVQTLAADFTQPLDLPPLDGLLIANALHFVRDHGRVIELLARYLKPGGAFIVVEYDVRFPRAYIPFPLPYARFESLAKELDFSDVRQIGSRISPSSGTVMVAALAVYNPPRN